MVDSPSCFSASSEAGRRRKNFSIEEVQRVVKKARLQAEACWRSDGDDCSSSDSDYELADRRRVRRRIEEKVSIKVAKILGDAGEEVQRQAIAENCSSLATFRAADAFEQAILPELEKIAENEGETEQGTVSEAASPQSLHDTIFRQEKTIALLEAELEKERGLRREALRRAFEAERTSDRWCDRLKESEVEKGQLARDNDALRSLWIMYSENYDAWGRWPQ